MSQNFKGDAQELKFIASGNPLMDLVSLAKDEFFDGAYDCGLLGDLLHDINRSPLANAISQAIFRLSFNAIYTAFASAGTFESYLAVFADIFGSDVGVAFTVPSPGELTIAITAQDLVADTFVSRSISFDSYVYDDVIWYDTTPATGHFIFDSVKGFKTQYELEQMLFEMVPDGIFTTITLTFGV